MNQTEELLFKKLRELLYQKDKWYLSESILKLRKYQSKINVKIITVAEELIKRGYNPEVNIKSEYSPITGQKITIITAKEVIVNNQAHPIKVFNKSYPQFDSDHSKPFEDEGTPDDDFID